VLLPDNEDPGGAARSLANSLTRAAEHPVTVGAAAAAPGAAAIAEAYQAAARSLDMLLSLDRDGHGATPDELGIYGLLFNQADRHELDRFIQQRIGPVLDYDTRRGGELEHTLRAYFQYDANLARTAAALYIQSTPSTSASSASATYSARTGGTPTTHSRST
jgi:DNA-binding PucR family transcriptional regulator